LRASLRNQLRYDGAPFEVELPSGRWLRVITRRHEAGLALCIHADISQLKRQQSDLIEAQAALTAAYGELALAATQDSLTGLANRRLYNERLDALLAFGAGLILIDVDNFKLVNDRFGHVVGDDVLRLVGLAVSGATEGNQALAARIGGEEFAVVAHADLPLLLTIAHDIRERLKQVDWTTVHSSLAQVTISVGVGMSSSGAELRPFKEAVDEALYRAKRNGKDRIELAPAREQLECA
jgi:diguanylate cyclase (GGDEF)-like protein